VTQHNYFWRYCIFVLNFFTFFTCGKYLTIKCRIYKKQKKNWLPGLQTGRPSRHTLLLPCGPVGREMVLGPVPGQGGCYLHERSEFSPTSLPGRCAHLHKYPGVRHVARASLGIRHVNSVLLSPCGPNLVGLLICTGLGPCKMP
jgi:hypothetical protein